MIDILCDGDIIASGDSIFMVVFVEYNKLVLLETTLKSQFMIRDKDEALDIFNRYGYKRIGNFSKLKIKELLKLTAPKEIEIKEDVSVWGFNKQK